MTPASWSIRVSRPRHSTICSFFGKGRRPSGEKGFYGTNFEDGIGYRGNFFVRGGFGLRVVFALQEDWRS